MALELGTRRSILTVLVTSPGLHLRELQRRTGLAIGALNYHIHVLKEAQVVSEEKERGKSRFYPVEVPISERRIIGLLRQENVRKIILRLLMSPGAGQKDLLSRVGLSQSALSWYLKGLENSGIVTIKIEGREKSYYVNNEAQFIRVLSRYQASFLDTLVDNFVSLWNIGRA